MKASNQTEPHDQVDGAQPHYTSFILRCQASTGGRVRARLVNVRSGLSWPVNDLDKLPDIVRRLLAQAAPAAQDEA
jgi:hypothetical protein